MVNIWASFAWWQRKSKMQWWAADFGSPFSMLLLYRRGGSVLFYRRPLVQGLACIQQ